MGRIAGRRCRPGRRRIMPMPWCRLGTARRSRLSSTGCGRGWRSVGLGHLDNMWTCAPDHLTTGPHVTISCRPTQETAMTSIADFLPYGPTFRSRDAAIDALETYYATGEFSSEERTRIERRAGRWVILVAE